MAKRSVRDAPAAGKRVLVRVDHNVPLTEDGRVADDMRIVESLETLEFLRKEGARIILLSHLGRPQGAPDPRFSLRPVARRLSELLGHPVAMAPGVVGPEVERAARELRDGGLLYLENLRFHPGEEKNDPAFAAELASLGELFVEEAFGTVHRAHASTVGVPQRLPSYAGFLVSREVTELSRLLDAPARPFMVLLGGAKVVDKLPLLTQLSSRADGILLGGALAFPFLREAGADLGDQPVEGSLGPSCREFFARTRSRKITVTLPVDFLAEETASGEVHQVPSRKVPAGHRIFDIGPRTRELFIATLQKSGTVFWNGPLGRVEDPRFRGGTQEVLRALAGIPGVHVSAGGDSGRALRELGAEGSFHYVSTGGGAALEFLEGRDLPGLRVLPEA